MENSGIARGNIARQANKKLRRQRILDLAVRLIASDGIEGFTINRLAREARVSTPTIHNLFGKKNDIIKELVSNLIQHMGGLAVKSPPIDPIENAKFFIGNIITEFEKNTDFLRKCEQRQAKAVPIQKYSQANVHMPQSLVFGWLIA